MEQYRFLMIGAHPDDMELRCGGLAMRLRKKGHQVMFLSMTDGSAGHHQMDSESLDIVGEVPTGGVLVDGLGIGDVGNVVLRDRKHLSQDGLIIVVMAIDRDNGTLMSGPDIISRGFVYVRENEDIIECSRELARSIVLSYGRLDGSEWQNLKNRLKDEMHRYIFDKIKRNPMILPIIMEI